MAAKIYLKPTETQSETAIILSFKEGASFNGKNPDENLACGECGTVLFKNMGTRELNAFLGGGSNQFLAECNCGALLKIRDGIS